MDLPAPTGPAMPTISPPRTESDTFDKIRFPPKDLFMFISSIMQGVLKHARGATRHVIAKLYLRSTYTTIMYVMTVVMAILSVIFVFTLPDPLRPKTSIGAMNMLAIAALIITLFAKGKRTVFLEKKRWEAIHYAVTAYAIAVLLSLLFTPTIQDSTPLRLLFSGVIMFWLSQEITPTERYKKLFIHILGGVALCIALLSLLQVAAPGLMNSIAEKYLRGRAAYGITIEFSRGRLLHWGVLVFIFPFFYSSSLLLDWKARVWTLLYVVGGYAAMLGSMIISNFRGAFLVFIGATIAYVLYARHVGYITAKKIYYIAGLFVVALIFGLIIARSVLGYNLLDRFLLRDSYRDVTETLGRITLFDQALTVFQSYPFFGAGYGNYYSVVWPFPHMQYFSIFDQFEPYPVPIAAHNEFYTVLAETGIVGFLSFLLVVCLIGTRLYKLMFMSRLSDIDKLFALTLGTSYGTIATYIWFENMYPQNIVYLLLMGAMATHWIKSKTS